MALQQRLSRSCLFAFQQQSKWFWTPAVRTRCPRLQRCSGSVVASFSTSTSPVNFAHQQPVDASRVFVSHTFYKGKSAISISPGKPVFKRNDTGVIYLDKEGCVFMEFAPSVGTRQYDWNRKQVFALSVSELGGLIGLTSSETCEFFHDPNMNSSNAGMVRKSLKVEAMPDRTGFFFSLAVVDKLQQVDERFMVPITKAEFAVMRSSFNFIIPYLLGWHAYVNPSMIRVDGPNDKAVDSELEWAK